MPSKIDWAQFTPQTNEAGESSLGMEAERLEQTLGRPITVPEYDELRDKMFSRALECGLVCENEDDEGGDEDQLQDLIRETVTANPGWTADQIKTQVRRRLLLGGM